MNTFVWSEKWPPNYHLPYNVHHNSNRCIVDSWEICWLINWWPWLGYIEVCTKVHWLYNSLFTAYDERKPMTTMHSCYGNDSNHVWNTVMLGLIWVRNNNYNWYTPILTISYFQYTCIHITSYKLAVTIESACVYYIYFGTWKSVSFNSLLFG